MRATRQCRHRPPGRAHRGVGEDRALGDIVGGAVVVVDARAVHVGDEEVAVGAEDLFSL